MVNSRHTGDSAAVGQAPRRSSWRRVLRRVAFVVSGALLGLAIWLGRPWSTIDHDLRGLIDSETFTVLHVSDTASLWTPGTESVAGAVLASPAVGAAWPAVAEASSEQARRVRDVLDKMAPDSVPARLFHGELLILAQPAPEPEPRPISLWGADPRAPFPFSRLSIVLEPRDGRGVALVRLLLGRLGLAGPLASRLPNGGRIENDVLILEDVPAVLGGDLFRDRIPPPRLVLACGQGRIALSTDLDHARALVAKVPERLAAPAPAFSCSLDAQTRALIGAGLDRRTSSGTARSIAELTGWPAGGVVHVAATTQDSGASVTARWLANDLPSTRDDVPAETSIGLVLADADEAAARLAKAAPRPWLSLDDARGSSYTLVAGREGMTVLDMRVAESRGFAPPAYRRLRTSGAMLVRWLDETAEVRSSRAVTPPPGRSEAEYEHIAEALAHATSESELPPDDFDRLVESRHLEWTAEWERTGLTSPGLALAGLLRAMLEQIGAVNLVVTQGDGTAKLEVEMRPLEAALRR